MTCAADGRGSNMKMEALDSVPKLQPFDSQALGHRSMHQQLT
jgi:hypothetical protein